MISGCIKLKRYLQGNERKKNSVRLQIVNLQDRYPIPGMTCCMKISKKMLITIMLTLQYLYDKYDYNIIVMILLLIDLSV